jgi:hypothetical protein
MMAAKSDAAAAYAVGGALPGRRHVALLERRSGREWRIAVGVSVSSVRLSRICQNYR